MRAKHIRCGGFDLLQGLENRLLFSSFSPIIPPSNLQAVARSATTVNLTWDATLTLGETGIVVQRSTNAVSWVTAVIAPPDTQSWIDSNLQADTDYFYRIAVFSSAGTFYSGLSSVSTPASSFADVDNDLTLFIERTDGTDPVIIEDNGTAIDVTVDGDDDFFVTESITRITLLRSTTDNGITINPVFDQTRDIRVPGAMTIRGTLGDDVVGISADTDFFIIRINEAQITVSRSLVSRISILTYEGNDRISIGDNVGGVFVNGGAGDDIIFGNIGDDRLYGGPGDDLIKGNAGNDQMYGGPGDDILYAQAGNDYLEGNEGNDKLVGGIGNDILSGGLGNDRLYGEAGVDQLDGGLGSNLLKQD